MTLIELMVVVVIVGVLAAGVTAYFARTDNAGAAKGLAYKVWVAMRSARATASNLGTVVRITFTDQTNSTTVLVTRNENVGPNPTGVWLTLDTFQSPGGAKVKCVTPTTDVTNDLSANAACAVNQTVEFLPSGPAGDPTAHKGSTVYVQDVEGHNQHKIYVYRLTGFSRLVTNW